MALRWIKGHLGLAGSDHSDYSLGQASFPDRTRPIAAGHEAASAARDREISLRQEFGLQILGSSLALSICQKPKKAWHVVDPGPNTL